MADTGAKKGKKKKGKTVSLNDFLTTDGGSSSTPIGSSYVLAPRKVDWADETEDLNVNEDPNWHDDYNYRASRPPAVDRSKLPTAPKASLSSTVDFDRMPKCPPYTAFIGNLPYDVEQSDVIEFFRGNKIKEVRIPRENETGRIKGFGYVEFEDLNSMVSALALNEETLKNRKVRVDVADSAGQGNKDSDHPRSTSDDSDDWRARKDPVDTPQDNDRYGDRGYNRGYDRDGRGGADRDGRWGYNRDRGGFDRDRRGGYGDSRGDYDGGYDRDSRGGYDRDSRGGYDRDSRGGGYDRDYRSGYGRDQRGGYDRDRGGYDRDRGGYDRDRGGYDRDRGGYDRDRGGYDRDRGGYDRDRGGYDRDRGGDRWGGYGRDRDSDGRRGFGQGWGGRDRDGDRGDGDRNPPEPKERPKLQLKKRTVPVDQPPSTETKAKSSIFGGAKPVDTTARDREIERKLEKEREREEEKTRQEREETESDRTRYSRRSADSDRGGRARSDSSGSGGQRERKDSGGPRERKERERKSSSGDSVGGRERSNSSTHSDANSEPGSLHSPRTFSEAPAENPWSKRAKATAEKQVKPDTEMSNGVKADEEKMPGKPTQSPKTEGQSASSWGPRKGAPSPRGRGQGGERSRVPEKDDERKKEKAEKPTKPYQEPKQPSQ